MSNREPRTRGRGGRVGTELGAGWGEVRPSFGEKGRQGRRGLGSGLFLLSFRDVEHRSIGTRENWTRREGAYWILGGRERMGHVRSMRRGHNTANALVYSMQCSSKNKAVHCATSAEACTFAAK